MGNDEMRFFAVKFLYDSGATKEHHVCIVFAESEEQARKKFEANIHIIFYCSDEHCEIENVLEIKNPDVIFMQRGVTWFVSNQNSFMW